MAPQFLPLHLFVLSLSDHKNTIFTVLPPLSKNPQRPRHNNKSLNEQMNAFPMHNEFHMLWDRILSPLLSPPHPPQAAKQCLSVE